MALSAMQEDDWQTDELQSDAVVAIDMAFKSLSPLVSMAWKLEV